MQSVVTKSAQALYIYPLLYMKGKGKTGAQKKGRRVGRMYQASYIDIPGGFEENGDTYHT